MLKRVVGALALLVLLGFGVPPARADVGFSLNFGAPGFGLSLGDNGQGEVPFFYEQQPDYYYYPRYLDTPGFRGIVMVHPEFEDGDWTWYDQDGNAIYYGQWGPPERNYYNSFRLPYGFYAYHNRNWGDYHRRWDCRGNCGNDRHDWNDWRRRGHNDDDNQRQHWDNNNNGYRQWSNQRHDDFVPHGGDRHPNWKQKNKWWKNNQNGNNNQFDQNNNRQQNDNDNSNGGKPKKPFAVIPPPKHDDNRQKNWQQNDQNGGQGQHNDKPKNWQNNQGGQGGNNQRNQNDKPGKPDKGKPQGQQLPQDDNNGCSAKAHAKGKC